MLACAWGLTLSTQAQPAPQADGMSLLRKESQAWVEQALAAAQPTGTAPLRMVVTFGSLDSRLSLAPCGAVEPYLPGGARLWGRSRVGLRCVDGTARWNVFLPVQVQAFGPAWVLKTDLPAGKALTEQDVVQAEVDWAQESQSVLADPAAWRGQTTARGLAAGTALRQGMVRPAQVFQAGASVRVVAQGPGFLVSTDGLALSAGVVGAPARVRMENGRVLSGTVLDMRTVRVDL
jgi:flagellar basal body P-ring formation protein FlgA